MKLNKSMKYDNVYSYDTQKGTYYAFRYTYHDAMGNRHEKQQRGFKSEMDAHKAELKIELMAAEEEVTQIADSALTVKQWAQRFVETRKARWRPGYSDNVRCCIKNYINPLIGNCQLAKLNKMTYDYRFIQPQLDKLSSSTIKAHHRIVMAIINSAVENEVIPRNRLRGLKLPSGPSRQAFSKQDIKAFNKQLAQEPISKQAFFLTIELTGMRRGEALALTWNDINFKSNVIHITKSRNRYGVGPTKTPSSNRSVAIPKKLTELLAEYQFRQKKEALKDRSFSSDNFIFINFLGVPFSGVSVDRYFKDIIAATDIPAGKYVIHSLRHTQATLLIADGVSPVDVAHRLGHASAAVTLNVYAHAIGDHDAGNAEKFSKIVDL